MVPDRGGQRIVCHDDDPADTVIRSTARDDDTPGRSVFARVVVIAGEDSSVTRYASWLADTYETQIIRRGETISTRPGTDVVVIDQRALTIARERVSGPAGLRRSDCRVLAPTTLKSCDGLIDEYITEPVGRDGLLGRVETAMRMAMYDGTIAELLSLTMRRRRLRTCSDSDRADHGSDIASLSERIDDLHRRIDEELSDVESQYVALLGPKNRSSTRRETEQEGA